MTYEVSLLKFQLEADLAELVEAIRADTSAGPIDLARRGVNVVLRLTDKSHYERPMHVALEVQGVARALLEARPECMPLANLASETIRPLPDLYGRGKDEGARMRGDLRARIEAWLGRLEARAARIDAMRASFAAVSARAIDQEAVYLQNELVERQRYAIGGPEKFVPPNYAFPSQGLTRVPLDEFDGIVTGDGDGPRSVEEVRRAIATLRFETTLL